MKSLQEQCREATKHIVLCEDKKEQMRSELIAYMQYKSMREKVAQNKEELGLSIFSFFRSHHFSGALTVATFVIGGTFGVSYAAEDTLPGDLLYNVKVNISEELKSALLKTQESRIAWERERAERRLFEASRLAAEGRLDGVKKDKVSKLLTEHTNEVVKRVRAIEVDDPMLALEQSSAFGESLDAHEAVLAHLAIEDDVIHEGTRDLVEHVRTVTMEIEKVREDVEGVMLEEDDYTIAGFENEEKIVSEDSVQQMAQKKESANMRIRATERAKARAEELLIEVGKKTELLDSSADFTLYAKTQVDFGKQMMTEGEEALSVHNYSGAYNAYRQAGASFEKVRLTVGAKQLFSIEIYSENEKSASGGEEENKTLEELEALQQDIKSMLHDARTQLLLQTGHEIVFIEKINSQIKNTEARMLQGEIAMVLGDYIKAESLLSTAHRHISRALDALKSEERNGEVKTIPVPVAEQEEKVEKEPVPVRHTFENGIHTYVIVINTPNSCTDIDKNVSIKESFPEQIGITFTFLAPGADVMCADVITEKEVTVSVNASEEAVLDKVTIDGASFPVTFTLRQESDSFISNQ